jgi:hypothetical protein
LSKSDKNTLGVWEREMFGPVKEIGMRKMRANQDMMNLYREPDIISKIRKERYRWLGHVERMTE